MNININWCILFCEKVEKWTNFKKKYEARNKKLNLCELCLENNKTEIESDMNTPIDNNSSSEMNALTKSFSSESSASPQSTFNDNIDTEKSEESLESTDRIKHLELELARVKLELVDAQCKNQEFDHIIKGLESSSSNNSILRMTRNSIDQTPESQMSSSTMSLTKNNSSNGSINSSVGIQQSNNGSNSWLSKTFTQFKEAKNQVVQKAQKVKIPSTSELNFPS